MAPAMRTFNPVLSVVVPEGRSPSRFEQRRCSRRIVGCVFALRRIDGRKTTALQQPIRTPRSPQRVGHRLVAVAATVGYASYSGRTPTTAHQAPRPAVTMPQAGHEQPLATGGFQAS